MMKTNNVFRHLVGFMVITLLIIAGSPPALGAPETPKPFSQEQLDRLLAPVALYPDSLLTQIFMASTYPLEVVKAMNWLKQNKNLKGSALSAALEKQGWDPSVKSLVNFPQVLQMMTDQIDWTQKLGDAFLAQQKDVMETVQKLRKKAQDQGSLKTTKEQKVTVQKDTQVIVIEPANPQVIYVPTYDPVVVYGAWWYPVPPVYLYPPPPPGYTAFTFATGVAVGVAWSYAWGYPNWHGGSINVYPPPPPPPPHPPGPGPQPHPGPHPGPQPQPGPHPGPQPQPGPGPHPGPQPQPGPGPQPGQSGTGTWQHDPSHRQGVAYRDNTTAQKYGQQARSTSQNNAGSRGFAQDRTGQYGKGQTGSQFKGSEQGSMGKQTRAFNQSGSKETGKTKGFGAGTHQSAFSGMHDGGFEKSAGERGRMSLGSKGRR